VITKAIYKTYCSQIAELFCSTQQNSQICRETIYQRLIQSMDDYTFETSFLPNLSTGRHFVMQIQQLKNDPGGQPKSIMEYKLTDVVTGQVYYTWEDTEGRLPVFSKIPQMLAEDGFVVVSQNKTFNSVDYKLPRIVWKEVFNSYGIVYVPSIAPGGGTPGGGSPSPGGGSPGGGGILPTPAPVTQTPIGSPVEAGSFDFSSLVLPGAIIVGGYFLLKSMKIL